MRLKYRRWRRAAVAVASIVLAVSPLSACGSAHDRATQAGHDDTVTISHKFGETKVPANPSRVVTVGWTDQDFVLPFGVVPVSTRSFFEEYDNYPWVKAATDGKGVTTWGGEDSIDFEAIAAQKPDLILAIYPSIDQETYDRLSPTAPCRIAPRISPLRTAMFESMTESRDEAVSHRRKSRRKSQNRTDVGAWDGVTVARGRLVRALRRTPRRRPARSCPLSVPVPRPPRRRRPRGRTWRPTSPSRTANSL